MTFSLGRVVAFLFPPFDSVITVRVKSNVVAGSVGFGLRMSLSASLGPDLVFRSKHAQVRFAACDPGQV